MALTTLIRAFFCANVVLCMIATTSGNSQELHHHHHGFGAGNEILVLQETLAGLSHSKQDVKSLSDLVLGLNNYRQFYEADFMGKLLPEFQETLMVNNRSTQCEEDLLRLFNDLVARKMYAIKVADAIGKPAAGLTLGAIIWLGAYEVCTSTVEYEDSRSQRLIFQGRHCLANIKGKLLTSMSPLLGNVGITVGVCVPNTCDMEDVTPVINMGLSLILKQLKIPGGVSNATIYTSGVTCAVSAPWKTADIVALVLASIIGLLVVCGSLCDVIQRMYTARRACADRTKVLFPDSVPQYDGDLVDDGVIHVSHEVGLCDARQEAEVKADGSKMSAVKGFLCQFLVSFSFITNGEKLLDTRMHEGQLRAVHGIRVISMSWVILGHTNAFIVQPGFVDNIGSVADVIGRFTFQAILNGTYSVDTFFFLSGLLLTYLLLRELRMSEGKVNWVLLYVHRFWRLTPVYMFVLLMFSTVLIHFPDGPFMRAMDTSITQCAKYWWTNLLYINNFIPAQLGQECMGWGWYLANDMQFFIISPVIIYLLYRFRYLGYALLMALLIASLVAIGVVARANKVTLTFGNVSMNSLYVQPQYRISPYLVGIATGYILSVWEQRGRPKIHKVCVLAGWCMAIAINMAVLYGVYGPVHTNKNWSSDVNALYISTSRFAWSLGLGWVTFACVTGYGGPVNWLLSWPVWAPLSRLTYCTYLVHPIVIFNYLTSLKEVLHYTDYTMVYMYLGHLVISYLVAFVISVTVEAPMMRLEKIILKKD